MKHRSMFKMWLVMGGVVLVMLVGTLGLGVAETSSDYCDTFHPNDPCFCWGPPYDCLCPIIINP